MKKICKITVIIAGLLALAPGLLSQNHEISFEHLTIEDGLSQSTVHCILKDSKGFMWFGTEDGLNRYDGYNFKVFKYTVGDTSGLSGDLITCLFEDNEENIWIGTYGGGVCKYDYRSGEFSRFISKPQYPQGLSNNQVWTILQDDAGRLLIGTRGGGLNVFDYKMNKWTIYRNDPADPASISSDEVRKLYRDRRGNIWIATLGGGLNLYDPQTGSFTRFRHNPENNNSVSSDRIRAIFEDSRRLLWIGSEIGIDIYDPEKNIFRRLNNDPGYAESFKHKDVRCILEDHNDNIWIGTLGAGLLKYDRQNDSFTGYEKGPGELHNLSSQDVTSLLLDDSGFLWIGTFTGGINKVNLIRNFSHIVSDEIQNGICSNNIKAIYADSADNLWIGTDQGLTCITGDILAENGYSHRTFKYNPKDYTGLTHNLITCISEDNSGKIWVGTRNGVNIYDPRKGRFRQVKPIPEDPNSLCHGFIISIFQDSESKVWIGTLNGISKITNIDENWQTGQQLEFRNYSSDPEDTLSLPADVVLSTFEDSKRRIWISTAGGGLCQYLPEEDSFVRHHSERTNLHRISSDIIVNTFEDSKNRLWLASDAGIMLFFPESDSCVRITETEGLANNTVFGIMEDIKGNLWISTNNGLSKFNPETGNIKNFYLNDGLQSNEFNQSAYCQDSKRRFYFGGINGFNVFYPDSIRGNTHIPPVVITSFKVADNEHFLGKDVSIVTGVELSYGKNSFSFEFSALDFVAPKMNQYAYMLEGYDKNWIYSHDRRYVSYTNLNYGKYVFRVIGSNGDGVWNEEGASFTVTIIPPYWSAWWFKVSVVFLFLVSIGLVYRSRKKHLDLRRRELEEEIESKTEELKQSLLEAETAKDKTNQRTLELDKQILEVEQLNRAMLNLLEDHRLNNKKLEKTSRQLGETNKELEAFAYSVSHDLRAPLRAIDGFAQMLAEDFGSKLDQEGLRQIAVIQGSARDMGQLIDGLLKFSRLGRKGLHFTKIEMDNLVKELFEQIHLSDPELKIEFIVGSLPAAEGDRTMIREVIANLLSNAIKYSRPKESAKIEISGAATETEYIYSVKDNGVGFDMKYADKLFGVFQRLHSSEEFEGTGVGLALVQRIIFKHGGRVWAEGKPGEGAAFHFSLPKEKESEIE